MKVVSKILCVVITVFMLVSLVACSEKKSGEYVLKYEDLTIDESEFSYILSYVKSNMVYSYQSQLYQYTGQLYEEADILAMPIDGEKTVSDYIVEYATEICQQMLVIEKLCKDANIEITDESEIEEISSFMADMEYVFGGEDIFDIELFKRGFSRSGIERFRKFSNLYSLFYDYRYGDEGTAKVSSEAVNDYFVKNYYKYDGALFSYKNEDSTAITFEYDDETVKQYFSENYVKIDHVLYMTVDASGKELDAETVAAKEKSANDAYEAIQSGEKTIEDFASENDDSGSEYIFTKGRMVEEFENAAFEMEIGETRVVKTQYGYHLMFKKELTDEDLSGNTSEDGTVSGGYKTEVIEALSAETIHEEALEMLAKFENGELTDFPETIDGKDYYYHNAAAYIDKNESGYSSLISVIESLEEGKVGEKNLSGEGCYLIRRFPFTASEISADVYDTIESDMAQQSYAEYVQSFYDSVEINKDAIAKFDVSTIPILDDELYV